MSRPEFPPPLESATFPPTFHEMFSDPPFDAVDSCDSRDDVGHLLGGGWVLLVGLVEKEVGGELLVLVAGKVGLDSLVTLETKTAELELCY